MPNNRFKDNHPNTCLSCGFLSVIPLDKDDKTPEQVDANRRWRGDLSAKKELWCFRHMEPLEFEIQLSRETHKQNGTQPELFGFDKDDPSRYPFLREVLKKRRYKCEAAGVWHEWVEHFGPQWHYEDWRMMELEKLRQAQAAMTAGVVAEQTKIAAEHAKTAQLQSDILARMEKNERESGEVTTKFNRWFVYLAIAAIILALGQMIVPDGLPLISYRQAQPIEVDLVIPTDLFGPVVGDGTTLTLTPSPELVPDTASPRPRSAP